jgi:putative PIN family toxin of toxin-antitoxin system
MAKSRVVAIFDANILVRLALSKSPASRKMLERIKTGEFLLGMSHAIMQELERVLNYPRIGGHHGLSQGYISSFLDTLKGSGIFLQDLYQVTVVEQDATDDIYLACSLEAQADYLVSEDSHLRNIKYFYGTQIVGLGDFQKILEN